MSAGRRSSPNSQPVEPETLEESTASNLSPRKVSYSWRQQIFWGKLVTGDSVSVDPESTEVVKAWLESFLGFVNYHREHISHLAEKLSLIHI